MTETEITTQIQRLAQRRLDIYADLQNMGPLSSRQKLCEELRESERRSEKLYAQLRWVRAGGWNPGTQHKPSRTAVLGSLRTQGKARITDIRQRRRGAVV